MTIAALNTGTHTVTAVGQKSKSKATAAFTVQTDWAQFRFDNSHSGYNPFKHVLNKDNVIGLVERWRAPTGNWVQSLPAVADGVVYVGSDDGQLFAFNAATWAELWSAPARFSITSSPAVANGV